MAGKYTKRAEWLRNEIRRQQKWIEDCERNGVSYAGPRGSAIRQADEEALRAWQSELENLEIDCADRASSRKYGF